MSMFLAPIHEWVYGKIQAQEELTAAMAAAAEENHWDCGDVAPAAYVKLCDKPLADVIDTGDIHGWLQSRMNDADSRFADLVANLLAHNSGIWDQLLAIARKAGAARALPENADGEAIYKGFDSVFLNGMPCDLVNQVMERDGRHFVWEQTRDVHGPFWQANQLDPDLYYQLRNACMEGMLENTGYELLADGHSHYELAAKNA